MIFVENENYFAKYRKIKITNDCLVAYYEEHGVSGLHVMFLYCM